jgi:apolipoprotein N-acyltransferase
MLFTQNVSPYSSKNLSTKHQLYTLFMSLITVLLFYLAFPGVGFANLAWVTIVPIIIALDKIALRNAFMLGLLTATLGWMCSIWWAVNGVAEITSASPNIVLPFIFLFCIISAIPYAFAGWLHVRFELGHSLRGAFVSATFFTVLVNYIPHVLPGNLAHALYLQPLFIQLADTGGVALVFFIIHYVNILIANGIIIARENKVKAMQCFLMAAFIFSGNMGYGYYKSEIVPIDISTEYKKVRLAILQPNVDISKRSREDWLEYRTELTALFRHVSEEKDLDLIIFPEVPVPVSYRHFIEDKTFFNPTHKNTPVLLTAISPVNGSISDNSGYFNTMELIKNREVAQDYAKQVLLPFGEYLPFEQTLPWLRNIFPFAPNYKPGNTSTLFTIENAQGDNISVIPLICYEAVFSDHVAASVMQGGELMINSSNDAWFADIAGKRVHLALSLFRSVEYRQYLVRATNTGLSGVIDPYGRFVEGSQIVPNTQDYAVVEIPIYVHPSFFQQHPNLIKALFMLFSVLFFIYFQAKHVKNNQ